MGRRAWRAGAQRAVACLVVTLVVVFLGVGWWGHPSPAPDPVAARASAETQAAAVLHDWDRRRAAAWRLGDVRGLRSLYTPGATAGARDVTMLRSYLRRGLRVRLHTQLLAVEVLRRTPSRLRLVITDRLVSGVAVRARTRLPLPRDRPTTRTVVLHRVDGTWLMARVGRLQ